MKHIVHNLKKLNTLLLLLALMGVSEMGWGQGNETFDNSNLTTSYADGSFVGNNTLTWNYIHSRDESTFGITGEGIMLRRSSSNSKVFSNSVAGGIGNFTCSLRKAFTGSGNRQVELFVNNVSQGTSISWDNTNVQTFTINNINIAGSVIIVIRNITEYQVIVDDITWTGYSSNSPNIAITGTTSHGSVCPNSSANPIIYTITNSGTVAAEGISVTSDDAQFVVSNLSSTTINANGGTATYNVTFTPSSSGAKTATITVSSSTSGSNSPTSSLTGTGFSPVTAAVATSAATSITVSTATLNGNLTTLGVCPSSTEKGFVYSQTSVNNNPLVDGIGVTKTSVSGLTTGAYLLALSSLNSGTDYSFKAYVYDGTTYTYGSVSTFTTIVAAPVAISATSIGATGFTANWEEVQGASSYRLDVSTNSLFSEAGTIASDGLNNVISIFTLDGGSYYSGNSGTGDSPASTPMYSEGTHSRGVSNGTATLTSTNIDLSAYSAAPELHLQFMMGTLIQ